MADLLDKRRYIFLSASFLSKQYKSIPADVVDHAIFFFGGKRSWLFPTNREEMLEARSNPAKYLEFDEEYKSLILRKEKSGHVFWLLPEKSYSKFSSFLEGLVDPTSGENYLPLILDEAWWKTGNNNHYLLVIIYEHFIFRICARWCQVYQGHKSNHYQHQGRYANKHINYEKELRIFTPLTGEHDYDAVMELLYQSNPTLVPTLYWAEG